MTGRKLPPVGPDFRDAVLADLPKRDPTPPPFSLRLTVEEREALEQEAGNTPLGAYIRSRLLGSVEHQRRKNRRPGRDDVALSKLLGELGSARLANNLNQLAKAANSGSLPVTPETEKALLDACREVQAMRSCLIAALGLGPGAP